MAGLVYIVVMVTCLAGAEMSVHDDHNATAQDILEDWEEVEAQVYIKKIFNKYGINNTLTFEGFEHLLEGLGLGNLHINDHDIEDHKTQQQFKTFHVTHEHSDKTVSGQVDETNDPHSHHEHDHIDSHEHVHDDHELLDPDSSDSHDSARVTGDTNEKHSKDNKNKNSEGRQRKKKTRKQKKPKKKTRKPKKPKKKTDNTGDNMEHVHSGNTRVRRGLPSTVNHGHDHDNLDHECLSAQDILHLYKIRLNGSISPENFLHLCPAIVAQLDARTCTRPTHGCIDPHEHYDVFHNESDEHHHDDHPDNSTTSIEALKRSFMEIPAKVWGFAMLSVTVISMVGLLCVAIVPLMNQVLYNHLIQFLVALAVGTLTGDALLHLIPHALISHNEGSHDHEDEAQDEGHNVAVYKGLVVLGGIYLFFCMERIMAIVAHRRQKQQILKKQQNKLTDLVEMSDVKTRNIGAKLSHHSDKYASCQNVKAYRHSQLYTDADNMEEISHLTGEEGTDSANGTERGHGHSHEAPGSVSAIAWMVIMGDGLHNFTDGMAIGAAFSASISVGLSTSIAVICHELPHELGDFAVLLRAGMTVKSALFYNIVSSILCVMGMVVGVAVGNITSASVWIFAVTAGIFIYISLVDMLPEITTTDARFKSRRCLDFFLQILGISTGAGIMLVIALYESHIKVG